MHCRFALCVFLFPLVAVTAMAKPFPVETSKRTFTSGGKPVRVEVFLPRGQNKCPGIVLVHDSTGMGLFTGTAFRQCSRSLAKEGFAVLVVHYFDRTGHTELNPEKARQAAKHWPAWRGAIRDTVKFAAQHPRVDARRIGLLGFSLGAYLSMAVATEKEMQVRAVVEFFGGLPASFWKDAQTLHFPPTMIIHGLKDKIVPLKEAHDLRRLLTTRKIPHEMKLYDCGHLFKGTQLRWRKGGMPGNLLDLGGDIADARDRTVRFFGEYLELRKKKIEVK